MEINTLIGISKVIDNAEKALEPVLSALSLYSPYRLNKDEKKDQCAPSKSAPSNTADLVKATVDILVQLNGGNRDQVLSYAQDGSPVIRPSSNSQKYYVVRLLNQEPEIKALFGNATNSLFAKALSLDRTGNGCKVILNDDIMQPNNPSHQLMRGGYQYLVKHETVHCDNLHTQQTQQFTMKNIPIPPDDAIPNEKFDQLAMELATLSNQAGPESEVRTFIKREVPKLTEDYISRFLAFRRGSLKLSREQEIEADVIAILDMAANGYDPQIAVCFWQNSVNFLDQTSQTETAQKGILQIRGTEEDFSSPTPQKRLQLFEDLLPLARLLYGIRRFFK